MGNWKVHTSTDFPIFPIFEIVLSPMGWGLLRNGEIGKYVPQAISHFPISQIVLSQMGWGLLGIGEMDWARFVYKQRAILSPCLFINARCVYKHGFGTRLLTQNVIIIVNANTHTDTTVDID